ncbi:putative deacylase [Deinococcus peraridilitoris DSM 19664]|uniref:Putative deacylase n=1 Tax=Deinococcus peraridilitoris (strain DSM 19664 / LMG 22246 / CIP 109416 / KR-200) TaxID=937777 RepID=L0A3K1_DEIPD|nr:putative deacylase [Deinococcus peraridilitoris DSM 19664]
MGSTTTWTSTFPWEGDELLAQLRRAEFGAETPLTVTAFVSESRSVRRELELAVRGLLDARGLPPAEVRVRSAYKPAFHWIAEEVLPRALELNADSLQLSYPVLAPEPPGRFLQETYPLSGLLEQHGLRFEARADSRPAQHCRVVLLAQGQEVWQGSCALPLAPRTAPGGATVLAPTGRLQVSAQERELLDVRLLTDAERAWDWYTKAVLPEVLRRADFAPGQPAFRTLSVTFALSEADDPLGLDHERSSMLEALGEEVYFGTLEALKLRAGHELDARELQPGRIVPVVRSRPAQAGWARVTLTAFAGPSQPQQPTRRAQPSQADIGGDPAPLPSAPVSPRRLVASARALADEHRLEWTVPAYSYDGRPVPALGRTGRPIGLLVTAGQHANEASGPHAALKLIPMLAQVPDLSFVAIPLENPDGAALHLALTRRDPQFMHHAARYTSLGDDLEARVLRGEARWEARARVWAAHRQQLAVHLSLHGYPSHEWTRPFSGYAPRGFESWALPAGIVTIIRYQSGQRENAEALAALIAHALSSDEELSAHTQRALRWSGAHVLTPHYELRGSWPFLFQARDDLLAPLMVITEVPDETVYGAAFERCVRAQVLVGQACMAHLT